MELSIRAIANGFIVTDFSDESFESKEYYVDSLTELTNFITSRFQRLNSLNPTVTTNLMSESVPF